MKKVFARGSYASLLYDLNASRVLEVVADRTTESATALLSTLPEQRRNEVSAVAVDRWVPFMTAVGTTRTPLLFTTSFISSVILQQWLTRYGELTEPKSVANENKTLRAAGIDDLVESRYI